MHVNFDPELYEERKTKNTQAESIKNPIETTFVFWVDQNCLGYRIGENDSEII